MKYLKITVSIALLSACYFNISAVETASTIKSVKIYKNRAIVERTAEVKVKRGENRIKITGLAPSLRDTTIRVNLPEKNSLTLLGFSVEQKVLLENRQKEILKIEKKLKALREKDRVYIDRLAVISSKIEYLNSLGNVNLQKARHSISDNKVNLKTWSSVMEYLSEKELKFRYEKRKIEKEREDLGKEIQKWEFELSKIAGNTYFRNFRSMSDARFSNRAKLSIQEFKPSTYGKRQQLFHNPDTDIEKEKHLLLDIYSDRPGTVPVNFSYQVYNTRWSMEYDMRFDLEKKLLNMTVFGDIYQKTGENWQNVNLVLSTGAPRTRLYDPQLTPRYIDVYKPREYAESDSATATNSAAKIMQQAVQDDEGFVQRQKKITTRTTATAVELAFPGRQTILSRNKSQRKLLEKQKISSRADLNLFYELKPARKHVAQLKAEITNKSDVPWLPGKAQIFLGNEFTGNVNIPETAPGASEKLLIADDARITSKKELLKKYEDTSGLFGGNRRIKYRYRLTAENNALKTVKVYLYDVIPVSRNSKIKIELSEVSKSPDKDPEFVKSSDYQKGVRRWWLTLTPKSKETVEYVISVTFDEELKIRGLP